MTHVGPKVWVNLLLPATVVCAGLDQRGQPDTSEADVIYMFALPHVDAVWWAEVADPFGGGDAVTSMFVVE